MFDFRKWGQLFASSSLFVGSFLATLSATATNNVVKSEKLGQQPSVILASSNTEKLRSQQKANIKLEELEPRTLPEERDHLNTPISYYNRHLRELKLLPSREQSREIQPEDNNVRRLLKQQLNDAIEIYQILGQLLDSGELDDILLWVPSTLPAIQVAIAETNLATNPEDRAVANEVGLRIAQKWEKENKLLEEAGLGFRSDVLTASYWRKFFEIQKIKLGQKNLSLSDFRESQLQQQSSLQLNEIELDKQEFERGFPNLSIQTTNLAIDYYNANIRLLKLIPREQSLKIRTEDSGLQKLQKQQLYEAIDLNRYNGFILSKGRQPGSGNSDIIGNLTASITLPAIQVAIADMNLATNPSEQAVAIETGLKIAQTWEKNAVLEEKTALRQRIAVLIAIYWRRHLEIQKLLAESNDLGA